MNYVVQKGDTMYTIARRFGVPLSALVAANPQVSDPNLIYPGQVLTIPAAPTPAWCTFVLMPVHPGIEPGSALVRPTPSHIMVAAMDMPDPSALTDCDVYTAWVMDDDCRRTVAWFDLLPAKGKGFWINHTNPPTLSMNEDVLVTAENRDHGPRPGNRRMLQGNLRQCCRHDP